MTDVVVQDKDVIVEVAQPTVPPTATPPHIGLVEINQTIARGSMWTSGHGAPTVPGGQFGDMYLDIDTGDVYSWAGTWQFVGTFAPATLTAAEILAALITVDGAGSGLDADLLDGEHGAYYAKQSDMTTETARNDTQDTQIAQNSGDIAGNITAIAALTANKAPIASPTFTGDPKAPTAAPGDNDTSIATTAFVAAALTAGTLPADILTKLLTVDGAGSGLDADLLDGQHGAYYLDLLNATGLLPAARFNDASHGARAGGNLHALATAAIAGFMLDAPSDSFVYGRKNGTWSTVIGGATTDDSPPAGPLQDGQLWWKSSTGVLYLWYDDGNSQQWVQVSASPQIVDSGYVRKTANAKNAVVNPAMQVSQQNGSNASTTTNYYPADQWSESYIGGTVSWQTIAQPTPDGSPNRLTATVTAGKPALAAGDYCQLFQTIEGIRIADLQWGTANAKQAVLRFGFRGPAGTYSVKIANFAANRIFLANFTITAAQANTDTKQVIIIPGDTTGTWPVTNTGGLLITFVFATGTTYGGGVAGWQGSNMIGTPANTNGIATTGNTFHVFDVGFHVDPDATGLAPPFEVPDYIDELAHCERYYRTYTGYLNYAYAPASAQIIKVIDFEQMRTAPSVGFSSVTYNNANSISVNSVSDRFLSVQALATASGVGYASFNLTLNARM